MTTTEAKRVYLQNENDEILLPYSSQAIEDGDGNVIADTYLKTDMSNLNPTQIAKDTIVGWGMPDYNSAISQSALTEYTATTNGYIHCFNYTAGQLTITLNGTLYYWCSGGGGNILTGCNFMMPVNKGDTYKLNNAFSNPSFCFLNFYPVKGAN